MKIKICGLTDIKEAAYLNKYPVDFAGMVLFYPKSRRNISVAQAKEIQKALKPEIKTVAVTVSPDISQVKEIEEAGFDYLQIHGHLPEGLFEETKIPVLKAFNVSDLESYRYYHDCPGIVGYVFDAQEPGSGKVFDWSLVKDIPKDEKLLLLAGGLNSANVAEAVRYVKPDGVDVSSGIEYEDGRGKDPQKIEAFVTAVVKAGSESYI